MSFTDKLKKGLKKTGKVVGMTLGKIGATMVGYPYSPLYDHLENKRRKEEDKKYGA